VVRFDTAWQGGWYKQEQSESIAIKQRDKLLWLDYFCPPIRFHI
jgi:hypothetical protein